jgi:toxin ParE1/3/4
VKSLYVRPEAKADIREAMQWYNARREGLGADFRLCVEHAIDNIIRFPEGSPLVHRNLRRALIHRFPYGIFFIVEEARIVVTGVIHAKRSPRVWKRRHP